MKNYFVTLNNNSTYKIDEETYQYILNGEPTDSFWVHVKDKKGGLKSVLVFISSICTIGEE